MVTRTALRIVYIAAVQSDVTITQMQLHLHLFLKQASAPLNLGSSCSLHIADL